MTVASLSATLRNVTSSSHSFSWINAPLVHSPSANSQPDPKQLVFEFADLHQRVQEGSHPLASERADLRIVHIDQLATLSEKKGWRLKDLLHLVTRAQAYRGYQLSG